MTTTKTIKVIHIDPHAKTIRMIDMPDDFDVMKRDFIKCDLAEAMDFGDGVTGWFDEEGLLVDWDTQAFTRFCDSVTLAGHVILTGTNQDGDMTDLPAEITVEFMEAMANFKFIPTKDVVIPGSSITTWDGNGVKKTEPLGPEVLTYDNH